jgi:hypothetical protein
MSLILQYLLFLVVAFLFGIFPSHWIKNKKLQSSNGAPVEVLKGFIFFATIRIIQVFYGDQFPVITGVEGTKFSPEAVLWSFMCALLVGNATNRFLKGQNHKGYWIFASSLLILSPIAFLTLVILGFVLEKNKIGDAKSRLVALFFSLIVHATLRPMGLNIVLVLAAYFLLIWAHEKEMDEILENLENADQG